MCASAYVGESMALRQDMDRVGLIPPAIVQTRRPGGAQGAASKLPLKMASVNTSRYRYVVTSVVAAMCHAPPP